MQSLQAVIATVALRLVKQLLGILINTITRVIIEIEMFLNCLAILLTVGLVPIQPEGRCVLIDFTDAIYYVI